MMAEDGGTDSVEEDPLPRVKAAFYLRASTARQSEEGFTLDFQLEHLQRHCEQNDYEMVRTYTDAGESGSTILRPGFQQMLVDAEACVFQVVLVYRWDRFSRNLADLVTVVESLANEGVKLESVTQASDDKTPEGRLMRNILGSFAQFELDQLKVRVKAGMVRRAKEGLWLSRPPYGYQMDNGQLVIDNEEAGTVRTIFDWKDDGRGLNEIARQLNAQGTPSKGGGPWRAVKVKRILENPVYFGLMRSKRVGLVQGQHEAIFAGEGEARSP